MWYSPVRIMRETLRAEASSLHWVEKVGYKIIFGLEGGDTNVIDDVKHYVDGMIKKYESETFKIRMKAYDVEEKGK